MIGTVLGGTVGYAVYEVGKQFWDNRWAVAVFMCCRVVIEHAHRTWLFSWRCACLALRSPSQKDEAISLSLVAGAVAFLGNWGGSKLRLDYSAKLFTMTFLLVTFGAQQDSESLHQT